MNLDPANLDSLHETLVREPTAWWSSASASYCALGFLLLIIICFVVKGALHWQQNRSRREALAHYARLEKALQDPANRAAALAELAEIFKQVALTTFPRAKATTLPGSASVQFRDPNCPAGRLTHGLGERVATYQEQKAQRKQKEAGND